MELSITPITTNSMKNLGNHFNLNPLVMENRYRLQLQVLVIIKFGTSKQHLESNTPTNFTVKSNLKETRRRENPENYEKTVK